MITEKDIDLKKFTEYMATSGHNITIKTDKEALMWANRLAAIPNSVRRTTNAISDKSSKKDTKSTA